MHLNEIKSKLNEMSSLKIREFSKKLIPNSLPILGCKVPEVRKLAKEICKGDFYLFLKEYDASSYELQLCYAYVIATSKMPLEERISYVRSFIKTIQDWAVCDGLVSSLKCITKNLKEWLVLLKEYQNSHQEFEVRFIAEILMCYYITPEYVGESCQMIQSLCIEKYYSKMGMAWFIATLMIYYKKEACQLLEKIEDPEVINYAIRKIRDSYRISIEDKNHVLMYKK